MSSCVFISKINAYTQKLCSLNPYLGGDRRHFSNGHKIYSDVAVLTVETTLSVAVQKYYLASRRHTVSLFWPDASTLFWCNLKTYSKDFS